MADEAKYPTRLAPYGLRIPPALKEYIQQEASAHGRSLHSEILVALQNYYDWHEEDRPMTVGDVLRRVEKKNLAHPDIGDLDAIADAIAAKVVERLKP
ncbi:Arc family DNA-binding protein [Paracoccus yeei]|nr:Arc family DNA-binding protein [Paracoccus yeei]